MAQKRFGNQEERSRIRNKIEDYNKYQWFVFIPLWLVTVLQMIFPARTLPVPEMYILLFDVGSFLFSITAFVAIRLQVRKLKVKLEETEEYTSKRI